MDNNVPSSPSQDPKVTPGSSAPPLRIFTREEIEAVAHRNPLLVDIILALQAQVQDLLARVSTLEAQIAKNSRKLIKPP